MDHLPRGGVPGPPRLVRETQRAGRVLAPQAGVLFSIKLMLYILTFCVSHGFMVCSKGGKRRDKGVTISIGTGILEKAQPAGRAEHFGSRGLGK